MLLKFYKQNTCENVGVENEMQYVNLIENEQVWKR